LETREPTGQFREIATGFKCCAVSRNDGRFGGERRAILNLSKLAWN
jgi:hypothetical protein